MAGDKRTLRILHFNDVYHVAAGTSEPVGGAARFASLLHGLQGDGDAGPTLTLFSGDAYFPSLESSVSHGWHMVPVLNHLNIDASTLGNHEFDQGLDRLEALIKGNNFPWVITNLTDRATGGSAARASVPHLVKEVGGLRVGIIGIIEKEWLDTLPCLPPTFEYHDAIDTARTAAAALRDPAGANCDLVVCLSHMRLPNDIKLADACGDVVDLVLGGHDHFYYVGSGVAEYSDPDAVQLPESYAGHADDHRMLELWAEERALLPAASAGRRLVKSGTDFRDLSEIVLSLGSTASGVTRIERAAVTRRRATGTVPEEPEIKGMVDRIQEHLSKALDKVVGYSAVDLEARSTVCRTRESNLGSLSGDLMRLCYAESAGAQIALLSGGAIRSDKVFAAGKVCMRDIMEVFPFEDPVVVVRLTGDQIRRALENGVSKWPAHEGRFPQVSGIRFEFDPALQPGSRVTSIVLTATAKAAAKRGSAPPTVPRKREASMHRLAVEGAAGNAVEGAAGSGPLHRDSSRASIDSEPDTESDYGGEEDEPLDMGAHYVVATRDYMYQGHDGYSALNEGELVVDEENGITFANLYERYFRGLAVANALRFSARGYAADCSLARHMLEPQTPPSRASDSAGGSAWKRLIIKHADNLRALAQQNGSAPVPVPDKDAPDSLASKIASVVVRFNTRLTERARLSTHQSAAILGALVSSATRLAADQDPLRVARAALFGHEDSSAAPISADADDPAPGTAPRNDDAGGLLPDLLVNRKDTRSYTSESLMAQWAVISPRTDGRIKNTAAPDTEGH
ncbi:hypothetical protein H4R19_001331 [Coemansia spiralis]|nr:hypothetical protein H4R19_001331 [Coemansia spiralis]